MRSDQWRRHFTVALVIAKAAIWLGKYEILEAERQLLARTRTAPLSLNFSRIEHLLSPASLEGKVVLQIGLGSGGAPVCDHLTMNGIRNWILYDPDVLQDVNLVKHPRGRRDLGRLKVEIQHEWILDRNPDAIVTIRAEECFHLT